MLLFIQEFPFVKKSGAQRQTDTDVWVVGTSSVVRVVLDEWTRQGITRRGKKWASRMRWSRASSVSAERERRGRRDRAFPHPDERDSESRSPGLSDSYGRGVFSTSEVASVEGARNRSPTIICSCRATQRSRKRSSLEMRAPF